MTDPSHPAAAPDAVSKHERSRAIPRQARQRGGIMSAQHLSSPARTFPISHHVAVDIRREELAVNQRASSAEMCCCRRVLTQR